MEKLKDFLFSLKFRYHITFIEVIVGYLIAQRFAFGINDFFILFFSFLIFCPFLYSGIYLFNDIVDLEKDKLHPLKKTRPLVLGNITKKEAGFSSFFLIGSALFISFIFSRDIFFIFLVFLIFNLFYTLIFKKIPYLDVLANAFTHPLRIALGIILAGASFYNFFGIIIFDFLVAINLSFLKRKNDIEQHATCNPPVSSLYSNKPIKPFVIFILILNFVLIFVFKDQTEKIFGVLTLLTQILIIAGVHFSKTIKDILYYKIWR